MIINWVLFAVDFGEPNTVSTKIKMDQIIRISEPKFRISTVSDVRFFRIGFKLGFPQSENFGNSKFRIGSDYQI